MSDTFPPPPESNAPSADEDVLAPEASPPPADVSAGVQEEAAVTAEVHEEPAPALVSNSPIPLKVAWAINIIGWVVFIMTMNHAIEVVTGVACLFTAYCGHAGKDDRLRNASLFEAAWMFAWAFGLFGSF